MAFIIKDRVKEITTSTGTGAISLGGASSTFDQFQTYMSNGDTTYYAIASEESGVDEWEVGIGTWNTGNTLTRTTILAGSNSTSAVNFTAGDKQVFMTYPAAKAAFFNADGDLDLTRDPQTALQAATKQYVDTIAAAGIHYHDPVRVEQEGNLSATYSNGTAGVGATLTNNSTQVALSIDGVTLTLNDRVLIYEQTNSYENGIYTVTDTGSASTNWVLTRATDADSYGASDPDALGQGDAFFVQEGAAGAGELYVMNTEGAITFGTTAITFTQVASTAVYTAGDGLTLTGTEFSVGAGTGVTVGSNSVSIGQAVSTSDTPTFAGLSSTANISLGDDDKVLLGASNDLEIYHEGATGDSHIVNNGTGTLIVQASDFEIKNSSGTITSLKNDINGLGGINLYYAGNQKLRTTSTGIDVTGTVTADGLTVDGLAKIQGVSTGLLINETDTTDVNSYLTTSGGVFKIFTTNDAFSSFTERLRINHSSGDISFYDTSGNAKFYWDASTMELGIGTDTPVNPLTVQQTSINWPYIALTNTSGTIKSQFGYQVNDDLLDIAANSGGIKFRTNNTETMRLTSAGVLLIGKTSDVYSTEGTAIRGTTTGSKVTITRDGNNVLALNRLSSDGDIVNIAKDGTLAGSIGVTGGDLYLGTTDTGLRFVNSTDSIEPLNTSTLARRDASIDFGSSGYRFKDLYLSGGLRGDTLTFSNLSGTERMRIDSSGYLLVGKTTNDSNVVGAQLNANGTVIGVSDGVRPAIFNRKTSDGDIISLRKDGTTVGSIGAASGNRIYIGTGNSTLGFSPVVNAVYGYSGDNTVDLGTSATRFKDLYLSGSLSDGTTSRTVADIVGLTSSQFLRSDADDTTTGKLTISGSGSIAGTTISNGYLQITDGSNTLAFDSNEIVGTTSTYIRSATGTSLTLGTGLLAQITINSTGIRIGDQGNGYFRPVSGSYGSIEIDGGGHNSYEGYSIGGVAVFMTNSSTYAGLFNDANNHWFMRGTFNGSTEIHYQGTSKLQTTSTGVNVTGALTATTKSFVIDHPTKEGMKLRHGSLEGPEDGVYVRGRLTGETVIELPDYWTGLVHEDSITVQLTAIGGKSDLWVESIADNKVTVGCDTEVDCFYFVQATRKDVDAWDVEYEA
jgi:hypothetical protein